MNILLCSSRSIIYAFSLNNVSQTNTNAAVYHATQLPEKTTFGKYFYSHNKEEVSRVYSNDYAQVLK